MDPDKLLLKINGGKKLTSTELKEVVRLLSRDLDDESVCWDDQYGVLLVLGKSDAREHHPLVARYLDLHDPLLVSLALEILLLQWQMYDDYLERVVNFLLRPSWDLDGDVQCTAMRVIGEFLGGRKGGLVGLKSDRGAQKFAKLLFGVFDDQKAEAGVRRAAYKALCCAAGRRWEELPSDLALFPLTPSSKDVDWELVEQFRQLWSVESSTSGSSKSASSARVVSAAIR